LSTPVSSNEELPKARTTFASSTLTLTVFKVLPLSEQMRQLVSIPRIPPEYLYALYTLAASIFTGWIVPNLARLINSRNQRINTHKYKLTILTLADNIQQQQKFATLEDIKRQVMEAYLSGKIGETHYQILREIISKSYWETYIQNINTKYESINRNRWISNMNEVKNRIVESYANGNLIEMHYQILREKIDDLTKIK
jgi:hypothetical protein